MFCNEYRILEYKFASSLYVVGAKVQMRNTFVLLDARTAFNDMTKCL